MKIIFVNRYFYPDNSATSQILSDLAFYLSDCSYEIHIVTGRVDYSNSKIIYNKHETIDNVTINRLWTINFCRNNLVGRSLDYLSFYVSSLISLVFLANKNDLIIVKTDPPMISIIVHAVCLLKRAKYINWLQDLFQEVGEKLGVTALSGVFGGILLRLRNVTLKSASYNVVIGESMSNVINANGIDSDRLVVINNWSHITKSDITQSKVLEYRKELGLVDRFIVGYSGNFGRAHDYNTIVDVISKLRENSDIVFLFIGGGIYYDRLMDYVESENISNVVFMPYQTRENLPDSLSIPDVHLVSLVPSLEGLIVPSKYYGIAAVGKAAIFIGNKDGEIARILNKHNCGLVVESGRPDLLKDTILGLKNNPSQLTKYGKNAYDVYISSYAGKIAQAKWKNLIDSTVGGESPRK